MSEVNEPLLRKAIEWAEAEAAKPNPVECHWRQASYRMSPASRAADLRMAYGIEVDPAECGTAYCIAGYVGQMLDGRYALSNIVDGKHVDDFAGDALGLTMAQADELFDGSNSIEDVRAAAERIVGGKL